MCAGKTARMSHPLIVSYYTPNSAYEVHARTLLEDTKRLGLEARIEPRPARTSWLENCAQKAEFIFQMHEQEQRPLLWIDADARLLRPLDMLRGEGIDFAAVILNGWEFMGGQIYFGTSPVAAQLLQRWRDYCLAFPHIWDQVSLGYAWWDVSLETNFSTLILPKRVMKKAPRTVGQWLKQALPPSRPCIFHQQESRRSKATQEASKQAEFGMDHIPLWWRKAVINGGGPFPLTPLQRQELGLIPGGPAPN